jgi:branched-chain amino acid transport system permease protein
MSMASEPLFRPLVKRGASLATFVMALAMAMIMTDVMARFLNDGLPIAFPESLTVADPLISRGVVAVTVGQLATIVGSIVAVSILLYVLYRVKRGKAFRVVAQDLPIARLLGIPITKLRMYSYLIAGAMGGISALFLAMSLGTASSGLGDLLALKVLAVALVAGIGNLKGGLVVAYILGLAEGMTISYLPGDWSNAIAFAMIAIIVMVKPQGLFGTSK